MIFTETLTLVIDYHVEQAIDSSDPYAHRPPAGRTASIVRLMTDRELSLTSYSFDVVVEVNEAAELWDGIVANLEYVLWRTPTIFNMDCERLIAKGVIAHDIETPTMRVAA